VTKPCRGATLIGNCLQALARIDAVGSDFEMKTGFCGKAGQTAPVGTGQGHVRIRGINRRWHGGMSPHSPAELEEAARRAVEAATAAGATDAEAWSEGSRSREVRVHAGEVESLTEASGRGVGIRAWIGQRTGYAYGTDLSDAGLAELAEAAAGAARVADEDENSSAPDPSGDPVPEIEGLRDDSVAETETAEVIDLAKRIERVAIDRDKRVSGVEEVVYVDEDGDAAIATSRGVSGSFGVSTAYSFLQAMATQDSEVQTGLGFGVGRSPQALEAEEIGAEAGDEASSMLGAVKPESRSCPVVLSERVTASFAGFIGGALCADDVQRGRSPFADRLGDELAAIAYVLGGRRNRPGRPRQRAIRRRGHAARADPL